MKKILVPTDFSEQADYALGVAPQLAQKRFEKLAQKDFLKNIKVHEHVEFHEIFRGIVDVCKKQNIDLILMG